jgi:hypothetical protein
MANYYHEARAAKRALKDVSLENKVLVGGGLRHTSRCHLAQSRGWPGAGPFMLGWYLLDAGYLIDAWLQSR